MDKVRVQDGRRRIRGRTRLTAKHQVTIPVAALRQAGLEPGDEVLVRADGTGRVVVELARDPFDEASAELTGLWPEGVTGYLQESRSEWRG